MLSTLLPVCEMPSKAFAFRLSSRLTTYQTMNFLKVLKTS